jgi:hypothetical protein
MALLRHLHKLFHPEIFQGTLDSTSYFEGWYFKLVDPARRQPLAVIPGVSLEPDGQGHAFVQVIDGTSARTAYHRYPLVSFVPARGEFRLTVGPNYFTRRQIRLDLGQGKGRVCGTVSCEGHVPWRPRPWAPGVMGWYSFVPFMECYHGLVSMDHSLRGSLCLGDREVDYNGGRGYIEKDWGTSFPSDYIWLQCNHFERPGTSLMASVARIPWLGQEFTGFIILLARQGRIRCWATYTGARLEVLSYSRGQVELVVSDRHSRLALSAARSGHLIRLGGASPDSRAEAEGAASSTDSAFGLLQSPHQGSMEGRIAETLTAEVRLTLTEPTGSRGRLVFEGQGGTAGLEVEARPGRLERSSPPGLRRLVTQLRGKMGSFASVSPLGRFR